MRFIALRAAEMHEHRELNAISPAVPNPNTKINFYYWPAFKSDIFVSRNTSQRSRVRKQIPYSPQLLF